MQRSLILLSVTSGAVIETLAKSRACCHSITLKYKSQALLQKASYLESMYTVGPKQPINPSERQVPELPTSYSLGIQQALDGTAGTSGGHPRD